MIECSGCKVAPERVDQTTLQRAGAGEQRSSGRGIADVSRRAGRGSKPAGVCHHAPRLGIAVDRRAPADQACLHLTCQNEAMFGIEDGDELRGVDSGWVQNSTLSTEDALAVVSQIAVRVDVAIESNGPHT